MPRSAVFISTLITLMQSYYFIKLKFIKTVNEWVYSWEKKWYTASTIIFVEHNRIRMVLVKMPRLLS